jgi:hypothetical protein
MNGKNFVNRQFFSNFPHEKIFKLKKLFLSIDMQITVCSCHVVVVGGETKPKKENFIFTPRHNIFVTVSKAFSCRIILTNPYGILLLAAALRC